MGRTIYYTAASLDGFLATSSHDLSWLTSRRGGDHPEWGHEVFVTGVGALCMGANTYRWLHRELGSGSRPWPYQLPSWVFSHRELPAWPGAEFSSTNEPVEVVHRRMAAAAGEADRWIVGGGDLAGQFHDAGLLDEIVVHLAPVTLGAGRPLLPRRAELELVDTIRDADFVAARYRVVR